MKKVISLILALIMIFTLAMPGFAAQDKAANDKAYDGYPVIIVRGINFGGLIYKSDGSLAMSFKAEDIFKLIGNLLKGALIDKNDNYFVDSALDFVWDLMGDIASDKDGTSLNKDVTAKYYNKSMANYNLDDNFSYDRENGMVRTACDLVGAQNTYYFNYDWRLSPEELAYELDELISTAKKDSGKDKVKMVCSSMGGMVATAYFYYCGGASVDSCTYLCAAHNGTYVVGDALSGNIEFVPESADSLFKSMTQGNGKLVDFIMELLGKSGIYNLLAKLINKFVENNIDKVYDEALRDILATSVGLWGLCPDESFDSAVEYVFGGKESEYPVLMSKLEECEKFVKSTEATLEKADREGVKLTFITDYDMGLVPVYSRSVLQGDTILEAELTSNYATVAKQGETLSDEYIAKADSKYISPDKIIDASTALYKDSTWFVKNAPHVACDYGTEYSDFVFTIILSDTQPTVKSFSQYPQFMESDVELNIWPQK